MIYKCLRNNNIDKISLAKSDREILAYSLIISYLQITDNRGAWQDQKEKGERKTRMGGWLGGRTGGMDGG